MTNALREARKNVGRSARGYEYGLDITEFEGRGGWLKLVDTLKLKHTTADVTYNKGGPYENVATYHNWTGPGIEIVTEHDPLGERAGFAGYMGLKGDRAIVEKALGLIRRNAKFIKDESPGRLDYIGFRKHGEIV